MRDSALASTYTGIIVLVNVIVFLLYLVFAGLYGDTETVGFVALQPGAFLAGENMWTLLTSMFMHAGIGHLFLNMISLFFIGDFVEKLVGKKRFLWLYFGSGLFAGLFFVGVSALTNSGLNVYAVGASGAIFGLGGLLAILTPRMPVLVFFIIPLPMWAAMAFLMGALWVASLTLGLPIGNVAHLGGLLVGLGYGFYLKQKYPKRTRMISRRFSR